jgi:hypothetical protein
MTAIPPTPKTMAMALATMIRMTFQGRVHGVSMPASSSGEQRWSSARGVS